MTSIRIDGKDYELKGEVEFAPTSFETSMPAAIRVPLFYAEVPQTYEYPWELQQLDYWSDEMGFRRRYQWETATAYRQSMLAWYRYSTAYERDHYGRA